MNVTEVLQFVDQLVFEHTGKHLDNVQKAIVEGSWGKETYDDIAQKCYVTKNHATDIGSQLWQLLSEVLNEDIKKCNFRSTLERLQLTSLPIIIQNNNQQNNNHTFNFGIQNLTESIEKDQKNNLNTKSKFNDLTLAPQILKFYNQETELEKLNNYIFDQKIKLISVLGLSGIGKTTLVKRFVDLNLDNFDIIIWKSLKICKDFDVIINQILNFINKSDHSEIFDNSEVCKFLNLLKEKRCLIIFDDVQELFIKGNLAGQYQDQYKNYQSLFNLIKDIDHQSHIILISDEQCQAMLSLDQKLTTVKCLELEGLTNIEFLTNFNLKDEESWLNLINLYQGNYNYLRDIAYLIKDIFGGKVADFLAENELIVTEDIKSSLTELFNKLSPIEKEIILKLSQYDQPITKQELKQNLNLSLRDLINGLQSLNRRFLIKYQDEEKFLFSLMPVLKTIFQ